MYLNKKATNIKTKIYKINYKFNYYIKKNIN